MSGDGASLRLECVSGPVNLAVFAAWIDYSGNRIFPYNASVITLNPTEAHNGSMLCCLYYTMSSDQDVTTVERNVINTTLLVYQKEMGNTETQRSGTSK